MANSLRTILDNAAGESGLPMRALTVLSNARDPYRLDTPAGHERGKWLADAFELVMRPGERIHSRGLHYRLVGRVNLPNGEPYINSDECWTWLSEKAIKAARFLGYISWSALHDARNAPPVVYRAEYHPASWQLDVGEVSVWLPETLEPKLRIFGDLYRQPFQQIIIAEKSGVRDLIEPIARFYEATLALPNGELSDQMLFDLLSVAAIDGRPVVIHQLGDFDPAGWQMAISTARTAQALVDSQFQDLDVRVVAPALTLDQCIEWDLPSTPLKASERRADAWLAAMGREQTELDAAVAIAPQKFKRVVNDSLAQFHDPHVAQQAREVRELMEQTANDELVDRLGSDALAELRAVADERLADLDALVDEINSALHVDPDQFAIQTANLEPLIGAAPEGIEPLFDSADGYLAGTQRLIERKRYIQGGQANA